MTVVKLKNLTEEEECSLKILKKHYGIKTNSGAVKRAIKEMADIRILIDLEKSHHMNKEK